MGEKRGFGTVKSCLIYICIWYSHTKINHNRRKIFELEILIRLYHHFL